MKFDDDDLKRLKDKVAGSEAVYIGTGQMTALLARLEAAEETIKSFTDLDITWTYNDAYKAWRKAAGK